jgi:membrane protease YdiL (CAAX protease family)
VIEPAPRREPGTVTPLTRFVTRHPVGAFSVTAFGLGWPLLLVRSTTSFASTAVGLAFTWGALLGSALAVTWVCGGAPAVRGLLARLVQWRFGLGRWAYVVLALPALTVATAALSGTLVLPSGGWAALVAGYLLQTFVYGAAEVNVAEEGAWSGLVQTRLAERHGVLGGALRTAPLFVAMHVPLQFTPGWTWGEVGIGLAVLAVVAPFFRYLLGETLQATGGSVLAAGVLHAAFNASGQLGFPGGWQFLPALVVLAVGVGLLQRLRGPHPHDAGGPEPETAVSVPGEPVLELRDGDGDDEH